MPFAQYEIWCPSIFSTFYLDRSSFFVVPRPTHHHPHPPTPTTHPKEPSHSEHVLIINIEEKKTHTANYNRVSERSEQIAFIWAGVQPNEDHGNRYTPATH